MDNVTLTLIPGLGPIGIEVYMYAVAVVLAAVFIHHMMERA